MLLGVQRPRGGGVGEQQQACRGVVGLALSFAAITVRHRRPLTSRSSTMHGAANIIVASSDNWEGGGGQAVVLWVVWRDIGGSGWAVLFLGRRQLCRGMRALAGMGRRAVMPRQEVTMNMLFGKGCGKARWWGEHGVRHGQRWKQCPLH